MMTTNHWAILGQTIVILFAIFGAATVTYIVGKAFER
jgi:hypothetical protein